MAHSVYTIHMRLVQGSIPPQQIVEHYPLFSVQCVQLCNPSTKYYLTILFPTLYPKTISAHYHQQEYNTSTAPRVSKHCTFVWAIVHCYVQAVGRLCDEMC
jgi:hypothetical protein